MSVEELLNVGNTLQETSAVSFEELHVHLPDRFTTIASSKAVPRQLASHFPVIIVPNKQHSFLINLYRLTFDYPELNALFEIKESVSEEPVDPGPQAEQLPSRNGGRKSFTTLIPGLAEEVTRFIKSQGFKAQERRREKTVTSCGVSIGDIRTRIMDKYPLLKEQGISKECIRYLL